MQYKLHDVNLYAWHKTLEIIYLYANVRTIWFRSCIYIRTWPIIFSICVGNYYKEKTFYFSHRLTVGATMWTHTIQSYVYDKYARAHSKFKGFNFIYLYGSIFFMLHEECFDENIFLLLSESGP